jgi:DNA invertase Pin-like site-specific DNA recombinase
VLFSAIRYPYDHRTDPLVLYLRESKDDELGIDRHRDDLLKLCAREGWQPGEHYVDNDESATPERRNGKPRPAYTRMLADAAAGKITRILCWHADRLVRHPRDAEDVIDLCSEHHVELWDHDHQIHLGSDDGRTVFRILAGVARGEVERKSARQKAAMVQRASRGPAWWPSRPFGYQLKDDSVLAARSKRKMVKGEMVTVTPKFSTAVGELVLNRREAKAIREAYGAVLAGMSLKAIAREWNSQGILTPKGHQWNGMAVRKVLLAPRNAALRTYQPDKRKPPEIVGKGDWPAIVTEDVFSSVRVKLTDTTRRVNGVAFPARKYLLSGLAKCSECGRGVSGIADTKKTGKPVYVCKHRGCQKIRRRVVDVDAWVVEHVIQHLCNSDPADLLGRRSSVDVAELLDHANALRAKQDELAALFASDTINASQLATGTASLSEQITQIEREMYDANKSRVLEGLVGVTDVRERFAKLPADRKRAVINRLVSVVIKPGQPSRRPFDGSLVVVTPR